MYQPCEGNSYIDFDFFREHIVFFGPSEYNRQGCINPKEKKRRLYFQFSTLLITFL